MSSIDVRDGRVTGVTLDVGRGDPGARSWSRGAHPRTTVLDLTGAEHFPEEVVADMRRFRSRGGSVKVNCILSEPPRYEGVSAEDAERLLRTSFALCPSIDYLEARLAGRRARPAGRGPVRGGGGADAAWTRRSPTTARP